MIFSFVCQQIDKINSNEQISKDEKNKYKQYLICFIKLIYNNIDKKIKFDLKKYEILYISLYNKINQIKEEYKTIYEIFINIFKNSIKNINLKDKDELNENNLYVDLDKIEGNIEVINIEKLKYVINNNDIIKDKNDEIDNKMEIEDEVINNILNKDITEEYNNFNSIII